jgi:hypothetical protein
MTERLMCKLISVSDDCILVIITKGNCKEIKDNIPLYIEAVFNILCHYAGNSY